MERMSCRLISPLPARPRCGSTPTPRQVLGIEYQLEADGQVAYEFDIRNADGDILEVEVNAVDGKLEGAEQVLYQIGHR